MRILYIINAFSWGGAEKLVFDLALNIRSKVDSVSVVGLYKKNDDTENEMVQILNDNGVETLILDKKAGKGRLRGIRNIYKYAKTHGITIIHSHCSVPMLFGKIVGKMARIPVVCTIHNTRGYSKTREKITSWMCNTYVSIGKAAEEYMVNELRIRPRKITRIYNAINTNEFSRKEKKRDFWIQYGGRPDETACLNIARVNAQKNQICLLRAIKDCVSLGKRIHLYILGSFDTNDQVYQELKSFVIKENLEENVTFLGMHKDVVSFLSNSDCFVMTSWFEGLSVSFLEAVISGTPIICTDMPFVHELMDVGRCATIIPQDDHKKLCDILNKEAWFSQSEDTMKAFVLRFGLDHFVEEHLTVYKSLER